MCRASANLVLLVQCGPYAWKLVVFWLAVASLYAAFAGAAASSNSARCSSIAVGVAWRGSGGGGTAIRIFIL